MSNEEVKITVVSENTVGSPDGLAGEWGLAMLVEAGGKKVLFDTGERGEVVNNAATLGIDLRAVDALVLSHGHYDHTGGLRSFLRFRGRLPVYAHPDLFALHYGSLPRDHYVGVPYRQEELTSLGADFLFVREPVEIVPGLFISGEVPRTTEFEEGDSRLFCLDDDGNRATDPFLDDMSLYCVLPEGLLIILGCAHAGVGNIVRHARRVTGVDRIYGIIGGTHLGPVKDAQREATIAFLKGLDLKFLAANHCTGLPVIARLAAVFGRCFYFAPAGASFALPLRESGQA